MEVLTQIVVAMLPESTSKKQLKDVLLKFLRDNNRPYSFNDIHERCAKTEGKSSVQKALESLVSREKVIEKAFGKQKIYFPKQENDENEGEEDISILERQLASLQKSLKEKQDKIKDYEIEMKQLSSKPSLIELEVQQDDLKIKVLTLTEKLDTMKSSQGTKINENDLKTINDKYEKYVNEFRKRKRICNNMIESILEGYPKTKKHLLDEVGVETDEMVNFNLQI